MRYVTGSRLQPMFPADRTPKLQSEHSYDASARNAISERRGRNSAIRSTINSIDMRLNTLQMKLSEFAD